MNQLGTAEQEGELTTLLQRIQGNLSELEDANRRLQAVDDRLFGPRPPTQEPVPGAKLNDPGATLATVPELHRCLDILHEQVARLHKQLDNLQRL